MRKAFLRCLFLLSCTFYTMQAMSQEVNIYFIRHGKTMFNTTGQVQGWSDSPLTAVGISQAQKSGIGLANVPFIAAFSSDMGRARATAKLILEQNNVSKKLDIVDMEALREWGYGGYEGRDDADLWTPLFVAKNIEFKKDWSTWEQLTNAMTDEEMADAIAANDPTGTAENYQEIVTRLKAGVLEIIRAAEAKGGGNVLAVSHGSAIPTILTIFTPEQYHGESIDNVSLTVLNYNKGKFTITKLGDTAYMNK